jgi:hypothetical protein
MRGVLFVLTLLVGVRSASADEPQSPASSVEIQHPEPRKPSSRAKWIAAGSIAAFHGTYLVWQHFAWYRKGSEPFHSETWSSHPISADAFAGGTDKFGHAWGNYVLTRGTTAVLVAGGWPRMPSSLVSFGLTELAYTLIEVQDGMAPYGFDPEDMVANVVGGSFGVLMTNVPAVDRLLDFRLEYFPSARYRRNFYKSGDVDGAQDYTGQSYILALHLGALPGMSEYDWAYWTRFVDFAVGYEAKHYYPQPDPDPARATMYVGLAVNMQGVLTHLFDDSRGRRIGHGLFEAFSLPYTTFRFAESSSHPAMPPQ